MKSYTQAAEADPGCAVFYSNRALAYLKARAPCPCTCRLLWLSL